MSKKRRLKKHAKDMYELLKKFGRHSVSDGIGEFLSLQSAAVKLFDIIEDEHIHITKEGKLVNIKDLSDMHLQDAIIKIKDKSKSGLKLVSDFVGHEGVINTIYGKDVKRLMQYKIYNKEQKRRKRN